MAVVWIYSIANEIVNLLQVRCGWVGECFLPPNLSPCGFQAFGIVIKLSDGILGLTLLAWGNSIGGVL